MILIIKYYTKKKAAKQTHLCSLLIECVWFLFFQKFGLISVSVAIPGWDLGLKTGPRSLFIVLKTLFEMCWFGGSCHFVSPGTRQDFFIWSNCCFISLVGSLLRKTLVVWASRRPPRADCPVPPPNPAIWAKPVFLHLFSSEILQDFRRPD